MPGLPQQKEMSYEYFNPNPFNRSTGDCVIRSISKALGQTWDETYVGLCLEGYKIGDWGNSDKVWGRHLYSKGFRRHFIPDDGLGAYTVQDFAHDNPSGIFILSMPGEHVVTVIDGEIYDTWNSGGSCPSYYWAKKEGI